MVALAHAARHDRAAGSGDMGRIRSRTGFEHAVELPRAAGNRALCGLVLPRPVVQRAMYLHNQDDLIYKDSNNALGEYAYVHKSADRKPFYLDYDNVDALQTAVAGQAWPGPREMRLWFDDLVDMHAAGDVTAVAIRHALGTIYVEDNGVLIANPAIDKLVVGHIALLAAVHGPRYNNVGGGSRLPRAEGALYLNRDSPIDLLTWLGVAPEDMTQVQVSHLPPRVMNNLAAQLRTEGITNIKELTVDPAGNDVDVVYASKVLAPRSRNARVRCMNLLLADDLSNLPPAQAGAVGTSFTNLPTPNASSGWVPGTELVPRDRGDGQIVAMGGWNALGAAAYANSPAGGGHGYNLTQGWEWLHVRGAKIGGATAGGNLVAGLFVTNSLMIPYEDMIFRWAEAAPTAFFARFDVAGARAGFARSISLSIRAVGHPVLGTVEWSPFITFDPLRGQVVDKVGGEIIKRALDRTRAVS